jgi:hypothetical protein
MKAYITNAVKNNTKGTLAAVLKTVTVLFPNGNGGTKIRS